MTTCITTKEPAHIVMVWDVAADVLREECNECDANMSAAEVDHYWDNFAMDFYRTAYRRIRRTPAYLTLLREYYEELGWDAYVAFGDDDPVLERIHTILNAINKRLPVEVSDADYYPLPKEVA